MVINHHKLRAETIRKFALFYKDNIKFGWGLAEFVYRHYKDYRAWLKIKTARRTKRLLKGGDNT